MSLPRKLGVGFVCLWFLVGGIGHFAMTDFFTHIVPPYIPRPRLVVYIGGVFEILGAIGLLMAGTRRLAGLGLFVITVCVTPANVHMWLHPELFPEFPPALFAPRLIVQALLLALILWSTQPRRGSRSGTGAS